MHLKNKLMTVGCVAVTAAALVAGMACNEHELSPFSKSLSAGKKQSLDSGSARNVDILFVVDDSISMSEEQAGLDQNFGIFLDKLIDANANFRLATVKTTHDPNGGFIVNALDTGANILKDLDSTKIQEIKDKCAAYYVDGKSWIDIGDKEFTNISYIDEADRKEQIKNEVKDYFRCQAIVGTTGHHTERGLASMRSGLRNTMEFKRDDSILAIVFVTDENDCSVIKADGTNDMSIELSACETNRNIEDSCIVTRDDQISLDDEGSSMIATATGQQIEYDGVKKTLREWCVQADDIAVNALEKCLEDGETCTASSFINCPVQDDGTKKCANKLDSRRDYYDFIVKEVMALSNLRYYKSQNSGKELTFEEIIDIARTDVIVASIINRDQGVRYNETLPENWCGTAGSQGYRYQLFAEMFDNDPIYAPICCKNEEFRVDKPESTDSSEFESVCDIQINGDNSNFGPVLGVIGRRIGEAVNQLCADTAPLSCNPADCNGEDGPNANCPCLYGCNESITYFANTDRAYNLCNEFEFRVGVLPSDVNVYDDNVMSKIEYYREDLDYKVDFESSYCYSRTGSPIQLNMIKSEAGKKLVFEYPKRVSSVN